MIFYPVSRRLAAALECKLEKRESWCFFFLLLVVVVVVLFQREEKAGAQI